MSALRTIAFVVILVLAAMTGAWYATRPDVAGPVASPAPAEQVTVGSPRPPDKATAPAVQPSARAAADQLIARYMDLRDDLNPVPRLALIEDAARTADPASAADLFAQAMVDPDERVRTRAQDLLDHVQATRRPPGPP